MLSAIDELVEQLEAARLRLEASADDPDGARATLEEVAELARTAGDRGRPGPTRAARTGRWRSRIALAPLRAHVESGLRELDLGVPADVSGFAEAVRYPLLAGGKRLRPVLCLATGRGARLVGRTSAADGARARARAHVLAGPRRPAGDGRRRTCGAGCRRRTCATARTSRSSPATRSWPPPSRSSPSGSRAPPSGRSRCSRACARAAGPARHDRRPVPRRAGARRGWTSPALERLHRRKTGALLEASVGCAVALAQRRCRTSPRRSAPSPPSSGCSSRSSTTCSTRPARTTRSASPPARTSARAGAPT